MFYPLIVLVFFIFFDVINRKKRRTPPQQSQTEADQVKLPNDWQGRGYEDEAEDEAAVPWYVEFPEDRQAKKQPVAESACKATLPRPKSAGSMGTMPSEPLYKRFETQQPQPAFKGFRSRRTISEEVCYGFLMAQILDKPRSIKPYDDNF